MAPFQIMLDEMGLRNVQCLGDKAHPFGENSEFLISAHHHSVSRQIWQSKLVLTRLVLRLLFTEGENIRIPLWWPPQGSQLLNSHALRAGETHVFHIYLTLTCIALFLSRIMRDYIVRAGYI